LKAEDFEQLSSKEIDFRETVIKFESKPSIVLIISFVGKKKRKEKKLLEKQMKKIKSANGEDGGQGTGDATSGKGTGIEEDDDDDTDSESKSVASGESDSNDGQHSGSQDDSKIKRKGDTDGISSITTKQTKAERNLYILRIAIDEKFIPQSIKNLRYAANIVFMILLLLASKISTYRLFIVIYYAIQISLFDLIN
jgi:hypothetical protein